MTSVRPPLPLAPAGGWFERRDAGGGVTHITEPFVDPFLRCNCWHVPGRDADLLLVQAPTWSKW